MPEIISSLTDPFGDLSIPTVPVAEVSKPSSANILVSEHTDINVAADAPAPLFIRRIQEDRKAAIAHTFLISSNITDYVDTTGSGAEILMLLSLTFDSQWRKKKLEEEYKRRGKRFVEPVSVAESIFAYYSIPDGLVFPDPESKALWDAQLADAFSDKLAIAKAASNPGKELPSVLAAVNAYFLGTKILSARRNHTVSGKKPVLFYVVFQDSDILFPQGANGQMSPGAANAIGHIRSWARDTAIGDRNTILMLSKRSGDVHDSIRGGDSGVSLIDIKKPDRNAREQWLQNFSLLIQSNPRRLGKVPRSEINYTDGMNPRLFAINAAGMNLKQMEQVILGSWRSDTKISLSDIMAKKKAVIQEEYGGLIEFFEPTFGFDQIGGHDNLKRYAMENCVEPMLLGDLDSVSKGFLIPGPPGVGKTQFARALAFEAKMNFIIFNLGKLMGGGLLGQAEQMMLQAIEAIKAAAPCIVFIDELDMQASSRDTNSGGGAHDHQLSALMEFLSDETRRGKITILSATNRPDRLESALIRSGRFDAIIPGLPPGPADVSGRVLILKALSKKFNATWTDDIRKTAKTADNGLGKLLQDSRIWTGAEMEVVLIDAIGSAKRRFRTSILGNSNLSETEKHAKIREFSQAPEVTLEDWNTAFDSVIPNTGDVEFQSNLALWFCNKTQYIPEVWKPVAQDRTRLKDSVDSHLLQGGLHRDA